MNKLSVKLPFPTLLMWFPRYFFFNSRFVYSLLLLYWCRSYRRRCCCCCRSLFHSKWKCHVSPTNGTAAQHKLPTNRCASNHLDYRHLSDFSPPSHTHRFTSVIIYNTSLVKRSKVAIIFHITQFAICNRKFKSIYCRRPLCKQAINISISLLLLWFHEEREKERRNKKTENEIELHSTIWIVFLHFWTSFLCVCWKWKIHRPHEYLNVSLDFVHLVIKVHFQNKYEMCCKLKGKNQQLVFTFQLDVCELVMELCAKKWAKNNGPLNQKNRYVN